MNQETEVAIAALEEGRTFRHVFYPLHPLPPVANGQTTERRAFTVLQTEFAALGAHFWGRENAIDSVGITLTKGVDAPKYTEIQASVLNHMLAVVRLTHNPVAEIVKWGNMTAVAVVDDSPTLTPDFNPLVSAMLSHSSDANVEYGQMNGLFSKTLPAELRPHIGLLAEAQMPSIPMHYRTLSLLRSIELMFPGQPRARKSWVNKFQSDFDALEIRAGSFFGALESIRSRCAHGWPSGGAKPFTGAAFDEEPKLRDLHQLLLKVVMAKLNEIAPKGLVFGVTNTPTGYPVDLSAAGISSDAPPP